MASSRDKIKDPVVLLALEKGIVSDEQVAEAQKLQAEARKAGRRRDLMRFLVESGALSRQQAAQLQQAEASSWKGRKLGDFKILSVLGQGGMGAVFKANQVTMDREIALKILTPTLAGDKVFRERFLREARAVAKLNHPNIVAGIDVGEADGVYYFAMEFIDGDSLGQRLKRKGKLPEKEALEYIRQTALALDHAHKNGMLHRDVKPDNVLIGKDNVAKLADLGLARVGYDRSDDGDKDGKDVDHDDPGLTRQGQTVGTPFYISPEQATGESDLTPGTDLYSLGATLFHLLTGRYPYEGSSGGSIMMKHVRSPVPDPRKVDKNVSEHAASVCVKLMQKDPKKRYLDARTLAEDLQRVMDGRKPLLKGKVEISDSSTYGLPAPRPKSEKGARLGITPPPSPATPPGPATVGVSSGTSVRPARVKRVRETDSSGGLLVGGVAVGACVLIALVLMSGSSGGLSTPNEHTTDQAGDIPKGPTRPIRPTVRPKEAKTAEPSAATTTETATQAVPAPPVDTNPVPPDWQPTSRGPEPADTANEKARHEAEEAAALARAKAESEREGSFLDQFDKRLRSGEVSAAESVLKDYESKTATLSVQYAQHAVKALKEIDEIWTKKRSVMVGKRIKMGNLTGEITSVEFDSFYIAFEKGMSTRKKWDETLVSERLNAMGYPEDNAEKLADRALYLYYRSSEDVLAATTMLKAQADGLLKLPEALQARCRATYLADQRTKATALIGKIKDFMGAKVWNKMDELCDEFDQKYGADFADLKAEVDALRTQAAGMHAALPPSGLAGGPTPETPKTPDPGPAAPATTTPAGPVQPPEVAKPVEPPPPVDPESLAALFAGRVAIRPDAPEHVIIGYDLTKPEHLNDWVQTSGSWEIKDGKLVNGGGKGEAVLTHKARFKWERTVSITATITFEETKDSAGFYFRDSTGSAKDYVQMHIGGSSPADPNSGNVTRRNSARNCGMALLFNDTNDNNSSARSWAYDTGKPYKSQLAFERNNGELSWSGWVYTSKSPTRLPRRKPREMKNSDWAGHPAIFSSGTQITVTDILIEGYLDPAWVASVQSKK